MNAGCHYATNEERTGTLARKALTAGAAKVGGQFAGGFLSSATADFAATGKVDLGRAALSGGLNMAIWGAARAGGPATSYVGNAMKNARGTMEKAYAIFTEPIVGSKFLPWTTQSGLGGRLFSTLKEGGYCRYNEGFNMMPNAHNFGFLLSQGAVKAFATERVFTSGDS